MKSFEIKDLIESCDYTIILSSYIFYLCLKKELKMFVNVVEIVDHIFIL